MGREKRGATFHRELHGWAGYTAQSDSCHLTMLPRASRKSLGGGRALWGPLARPGN